MVKTSLKLLLVFVEYTESNAALLIKAVNTVDTKKSKTLDIYIYIYKYLMYRLKTSVCAIK